MEEGSILVALWRKGLYLRFCGGRVYTCGANEIV